MKILELHITEFGCLTDRHLIPDEGMNLLVGDNETGKSTVMLFIKFMLYGLPKRGTPERERSVSRLGHRAAGSMTVSHGTETYRIERSYSDGGRGSDKHTVIRMRDGETVFAGEEPGQALLGVPREVFESSCGIGQLQCAGIGGKKEAAAIRNLLTSADESVDIERIEKRLEAIRVLYRHKRGEGGRLNDLDSLIAEEQQRLEKAIEGRLRIETLEADLRANAAKIEEKEQQLKRAELLLTEIHKIEVLRRFDALRQNSEECAHLRAQTERLRKETLQTEYMPVSADIARLTMLSDSLKRAETEQAEAEEACRTLQTSAAYNEEAAAVGEQLERSGGVFGVLDPLRRALRLAKVGAVSGLCGVGLLLVAVGLIFFSYYVFIGFGLAIVGIFLASLGLTLSLRGRKTAKRIAAMFNQSVFDLPAYLNACAEAWQAKREAQTMLTAAQTKADSAAQHAAHQQAALRAALDKTAPRTEATVEAGYEEARRLEAFLSEYEAGKSKEKTLSELVESDRRILSVHDEAALRDSLTISPEKISREMTERAAQEKQFYGAQLQTLRMQESRWRTELINCRVSTQEPLVLSDRIASLKKQREEGEAYYDALMTAMEAVRRAGETMRGNITPAISHRASELMRTISQGKYADLRMNGELELSLFEEGGLSSDASTLSGGTRDAAYIALRIALMQQLFGEEMPPLLMDETLCQTDDSRSERILSLLNELSRQGLQVLLFTCHRREEQICKKMGISVKLHRFDRF